MCVLVGGFERLCPSHHVDYVCGSGDVKNFHDGIIERVECGE